ncbi:MAG: Mor transcription activator family protein [Clostridia bacterium]
MRDLDLLNQVHVDDLPEGCKELAQVIGMDTFIDLIEYSGGGSMYFPSKGSVIKNARNRIIKNKFNGANYKELSKTYGISEIQIRNIIN